MARVVAVGMPVTRAFDLIVCILALPVTFPLMVAIAVIVRIHFGSPVLFTQERLGSQGRPFLIRKFRTMVNALDAGGKLLPDEDRLTGVGRFLRATSMDELPELINVFRGEMSLVGPRPLYSHYRDRYTAERFRRHEVLPGITGGLRSKDEIFSCGSRSSLLMSGMSIISPWGSI